MASGENDLNSILSSMTAEEKGGQVLMVPPTKERNRDLRLGSWLVKDTDLDENLETATAIVAEMQRMNAETSRIPIWMHGFVYRAPWAFPRDGKIVKSHSEAEIEEMFFDVGRRWRGAGLHTYPSPTVGNGSKFLSVGVLNDEYASPLSS